MTGGPGFKRGHWLLVICAAALAIRLFFVIFLHDPIPAPAQVNLDEVDFDYLGMKFATGEGLTDKYGEPTTVRFPLYPLFIGIVYFIFGYHPNAVFIIQALLGAVIPLIVFYLARELLRERAALLAGVIAAVYPSYIALCGQMLTENLFLPQLALLMLFALRLRREFSWFNAAVTGFLIGLCSLTRGTTVPLIAIAPIAVVIFWKAELVERLKKGGVITAAALVILSPWVARNYHHFNRVFLTSSSGGIVLWMSYNWVSPGEYFKIDRAYAYVDSEGRDNADLRVFNRILVEDNYFGKEGAIQGFKTVFPEMDFPDNEVDLNRAIVEIVKDDLKRHPKIFIIKTIKDFLRFWHFLDSRGDYVLGYGLILPFFIAGLWLARKRMGEFGLLLLFFAYTWALETGFMAAARFRMPFEVVMIVVGAYAISLIYERWKPWILPTGITAAVLAVNLYFTYNVSTLRNFIRSAAVSVGLPVAEEDENMLPQLKRESGAKKLD